MLKGKDGELEEEERVEEVMELEGNDNEEISLHTLKGIANNKIIKVEGKKTRGKFDDLD